MHKITYALVAWVAFWIGTVHEAAREPVQQFKRVRQPEKLTPALTPICENLTEIRRACIHRRQSDLVRQINPNTKGKL